MTLYVIGITGDDLNRNKKMAMHLQEYLDATYKEFYKTPNYRKYLNCILETFQDAIDKTVMSIHETSHNRKININKQVLYNELKELGDGLLWDNIMIAKLEEYKDQAKRKPHYDFYVIIFDILTENQISILQEYDATMIYNFPTVKPESGYDIFSYKLLNLKRSISGSPKLLEYSYQLTDLWYHHNKPDHYMKEYALDLINSLNKSRIYQNRIT